MTRRGQSLIARPGQETNPPTNPIPHLLPRDSLNTPSWAGNRHDIDVRVYAGGVCTVRMSGSVLQTEFEFVLPHGYADEDGELHREGVMRLATAADEIKPLTDPRVQSNSSYLTVILLARVVTRLGTLEDVTPHVIENLFVSDLAYLQELYERVNTREDRSIETTCPECGEEITVPTEPTDVSFGDG